MELDEWRWIPRARALEDTYILGDVIARGEFSSIHKCLYKGKAERVCKIYHKMHLDHEKVPAQVATLLRLSHPNIVQTRDIFESASEVQIVCDWMTGGELFERIVECGNYSELEAAKAIKQILSGLQYLHDQGLTHGSLRPENLLYDTYNPNSKLKLSNISLRKRNHSPRLVYSAPELFELKDITPASDMWSIGIVLYILLCGIEPLFNEGEFSAKFPGVWWDEISPSAKDFIGRCVRRDPAERITTESALQHPWICGETAKNCHLESTQVRLRQFNARRKFKAATQAVLATHKAMNLISPQRKTATSR